MRLHFAPRFSFVNVTAFASASDNIVLLSSNTATLGQPHLRRPYPILPYSIKTTMSTVHIHNWTTDSTVPTIPDAKTQTTTVTPKETKEEEISPTDSYLKNLTLTPASTILPKTTLFKKATSSKTVSNRAKPKITQHGPDTVEIPTPPTTSPSDPNSHKPQKQKKTTSKPKTKHTPKVSTPGPTIPPSSSPTSSKSIQKDHNLKNGYVPTCRLHPQPLWRTDDHACSGDWDALPRQ